MSDVVPHMAGTFSYSVNEKKEKMLTDEREGSPMG